MPRPPEPESHVDATSLSGSDEELLHLVCQDDEAALRSLIRRHERRMYAVALAMTRNPFDAEEVVGVALLELWRKREGVRVVNDSVLPWLMKVTTFAAKNQLRGQRRYTRALAKVPRPHDVPDHAEEIARALDRATITRDIETALRAASAKDASIILLCLVEEMSTDDAAAALGVAPSTVRSRLSRAKARLRTTLAHHDPVLAEDRA